MKKRLLGAMGLGILLASCGTGLAPDGSGSGTVESLRTEYRLSNGQFIGCDNVGGVVASTQVSVYFTVSGNVQTVDVGLRGNTSNVNDNNYNARFTGSQLAALGTNRFRATFDANPATGGFLPQAIVVTPARRTVKIVSASNTPGSFYTALNVNTGTATYGFDSRLINGGNVPVYSNCTVQSVTNEDI